MCASTATEWAIVIVTTGGALIVTSFALLTILLVIRSWQWIRTNE